MHKKWRLTTRCHLFSACWPDLHSCDWICVSVECVSVVVLRHTISKLVEFSMDCDYNIHKGIVKSQRVYTFSTNLQKTSLAKSLSNHFFNLMEKFCFLFFLKKSQKGNILWDLETFQIWRWIDLQIHWILKLKFCKKHWFKPPHI